VVRLEKVKFAIVGGYSFFKDRIKTISLSTPYGEVDSITTTKLDKLPIVLLDRHGREHELPPHKINYKANMWALRKLGVEWILSYGAVGSLRKELRPSSLVIPHDFIDFSITRHTFFEGGSTKNVRHIDLTQPFCPSIRKALLFASQKLGIQVRPQGVYVCTEGPRFETPSEIKSFQILGGDIIGMTVPREAILAKELGICYGNIAIITNYACGISDKVVSYREIVQIMRERRLDVENIIINAIKILAKNSGCECKKVVKNHAFLETWGDIK
jgi:5'-methylthioadenosine phosphorylase